MYLLNIFKLYVLLIVFFILFSLFFAGCANDFIFSPINSTIISDLNLVKPSPGSIIIENGAEYTKDCTPILAVYFEGAAYMSFSGDGKNWADWVNYNTFYEGFNIANGMNGTELSSGTKCVYVRFKDEEGNLFPSEELAFDIIEYEMAELYSIKIFPQEVAIPVEENCQFTLQGYDCGSKNEVPLDSTKVIWTKPCSVGNLSPTIGLSTTYTAPSVPGKRNITAHYNNLQTGAIVIVVEDE